MVTHTGDVDAQLLGLHVAAVLFSRSGYDVISDHAHMQLLALLNRGAKCMHCVLPRRRRAATGAGTRHLAADQAL